MKGKRLFDFSVVNAVIVILAMGFILTFAIFLVQGDGTGGLGIALISLVAFGVGFIGWYFVIKAPLASTDGVKHGAKFIPADKLLWFTKYNKKYRVKEIVILNNTLNYAKMDIKEERRALIVVQETKRNIALLTQLFAAQQTEDGKYAISE